MGEGSDHARLIAWHHETTAAHRRLRAALDVVRDAIEDGRDIPAPERELLLYCHGFCVALSGHHRGEDDALFPALLRQRPELREAVDSLRRDHSMIEHLLGSLRIAVDSGDPPAALERHLDGIAAVVETHFPFEERRLLPVLEGIRPGEIDATPRDAFGPL